ncbi:MAG: D-alanyl-D-alanine carboxypeptidase/D-alanyl-D-alanine-endopeptidase [Pseudomonadota bacterium]|nr:D-alanyl-D-alanine carboxypeptidase/D-alanyl-D-alanine-endopeptidase [Pseudomonadota bacterium]
MSSKPYRYTLNFALALTLAPLIQISPAAADWSALHALQAKRGVHVTAAAVDLASGKTLQALNPEQRLTPASLSKIVLAGAAFDNWPGDKTFATRVISERAARGDKLDGDLIVYSEGDATLDHQSLWFLAAQVRQTGIRKVKGGLIVKAAPFGALDCETKDRCEAQARSHTAYDAPLAAFGVDYGTWCVDITPSQAGDVAQVQSCAAVDVPIPLEGEIQTRQGRPRTWMWLDRITRGEDEALVMDGDISAKGSGQRLYRSMTNPSLGAGMLLKQILGEVGVDVEGDVRVDNGAVPQDVQVLASIDSKPLNEQVASLLRYSNNYITDVLTLALAASRTPKPAGSLAEASRPLEDFILRAREGMGYPAPRDADDRPRMLSGSGLTPESKLSAQDLVAVLTAEYRDTQRFPLFYAGLVVPAQAPHAYLRHGNRDWKDRVSFKTGTLSEPHSAFGIAGYMRRKDGGWIAFTALVNGASARKSISMRESLDAIRKDVEDLLKRY